MFEIESKSPDEVAIITKKTTIKFNLADSTLDAGLQVGPIEGPGEFEIGEAAIRGIATEQGKTIYEVEIGNVHTAIIGAIEENMDDYLADILCTSSVRAVRELEPKVVIAMGNVDGMVSELKLTARTERRFKVKSLDSLPTAKEVIVLN